MAQYSGAHVYNYAVSGAVCDNNVTPRFFSAIDAPFPAVAQYEVPAYIQDSHYYYPNHTKFMVNPPDQTVYSIFIGTNDLGNDAFITDSQVAGTNIVNYTECVYNQLDRVYANGGRYFVIQNVAPLNLNPQYGLPGKGGLNATQYWPDKTGNLTEISYKMYEYVSLVNAVFQYETPYQVEVAKRYPGAHFAVMDINGLVSTYVGRTDAWKLALTCFRSSPTSTTTRPNISTAPHLLASLVSTSRERSIGPSLTRSQVMSITAIRAARLASPTPARTASSGTTSFTRPSRPTASLRVLLSMLSRAIASGLLTGRAKAMLEERAEISCMASIQTVLS